MVSLEIWFKLTCNYQDLRSQPLNFLVHHLRAFEHLAHEINHLFSLVLCLNKHGTHHLIGSWQVQIEGCVRF